MMLKDLVLKNRSYRGFDESVRISRETLEGFVDCARLCPSSVNKQPLKYFLAWEPEEVEKVQGLTKWARALPEMVLPHPGKRPTGFVVICQNKRIDENLNRYQKDVGIVAQTMLLAAEEIHLVDVPEDGNTNYYRDENDVHYVPKRTLADELLN